MTDRQATLSSPSIAIDVAESPAGKRRGHVPCRIGEHVEFSTESLETYCVTNWEPVVYDALLVAAAVEFADRKLRRPALKWDRQIEIRIPVHDPDRWNHPAVSTALHDALEFLTGDSWHITFRSRLKPLEEPQQRRFELAQGITSVIPYSDGLDSRVVAGLMSKELGDKLICVRLGSKRSEQRSSRRYQNPFTAIPYEVKLAKGESVESSVRSRGFKFALISGLAAYLAKANQIIVSESGQGSLGPALVTVGQAYEDYRTHPLFTHRMEKLLAALLDHTVQFQFPRVWHTKAETLAKYVAECQPSIWSDTLSCWQQNRQVSVDHKRRQCGICAACMLRRMSIHAAGLTESKETYVWEHLDAKTFDEGAASSFSKTKITGKLREYAIAGALHLDHLAGLQASRADAQTLELNVFQLSRSLGIPEQDVRAKLNRLLSQHETEWKEFVHSLGKNSFVAMWAIHASL
jgi:7-cyano-7-deazaguanine synthase in queuosine biosynthesis